MVNEREDKLENLKIYGWMDGWMEYLKMSEMWNSRISSGCCLGIEMYGKKF